MTDTPFNGAPAEAFDHDDDGKPGGSRPNPVRIPAIDLAAGSVVLLTAAQISRRGAAVRRASAQDLEIAGRRDLLDLASPQTSGE